MVFGVTMLCGWIEPLCPAGLPPGLPGELDDAEADAVKLTEVPLATTPPVTAPGVIGAPPPPTAESAALRNRSPITAENAWVKGRLSAVTVIC